jgi:hypothetical protein
VTIMHLNGDFLIRIEQLQPLAANDNRIGDERFNVRNLVSTELTYTLAMFVRDDGAP